MKRLLTYAAVMTLTLTACNNGKEPIPRSDAPRETYRSEDAIKNGDVVNIHGDISNLDRFYSFIGNVEGGKKDKIRITMYTVEGDPIFHTLDYSEDKIQYTFDNSQDAFGSDRGEQSTTCTKIDKKQTDKGEEYRLSGCSSEVGNSFYFRVEK